MSRPTLLPFHIRWKAAFKLADGTMPVSPKQIFGAKIAVNMIYAFHLSVADSDFLPGFWSHHH